VRHDAAPAGPAAGAAARQPSDETLWREFAEASTADAFYRSWLALQCRFIDGVGSAVVVAAAGTTGRFAPVAVWPAGTRSASHLGEAADKALAERRGVVLRQPANGTGEGERYDLAYPIQTAGKVYGVVALDIAARPDTELQAVLRQLQWGAGWLELVVHRLGVAKPPAAASPVATPPTDVVLGLLATALTEDRFYAAAMAFATAIAGALDCDRVSLGFVKRGRTRVRAISHSAQFSNETNIVRSIEAAMDEAVDQHEAVVYPPDPGREPRIARAHEALARQHDVGSVCSVPLIQGRRIVGAVTLERPALRPFQTPTVELCEALAAVAGPVLELHRRDDRWLATKALETCARQLGAVIGPRHLALKLAVVAVAATAAFLAVATAEYRVSARTVMEARIKRAAVAPFEGYIREAPVRAGDLVRAGDVLAVLDDRELKLERAKWLSQQEQLLRQYSLALAKREAAQVNIISAQIDQAKAQLALLDEHLARTKILAAFDGVVVTGDLSQSLGVPVERGQPLFEVAPLEEYRAVLQVDERDIADVAVGRPGQLLLAAWPSEPVGFTVQKITPVSTAREGRNYFRVEAQLDVTPARMRPGMEGVGKVHVGERLLAWIWTRQIIDWVRLKLWTWLP